MRVDEVMTKGAECIAPDASLREAAGRMKDLDCGALPVCDADRLIGVLTDRDITVRSVAAGHDPKADKVRDVMTPGLVYCFDDQDAEEAAQIMREKQIRRIPVLNREKRLVGIVSLGDLALQTGDRQMAGRALEGVSEPGGPRR
jgi:CBS domain-containing protein